MDAKVHKWGGSVGILVSRKQAEILNLREGEDVSVEITKKENPLKELFGSGRANKITRKEFLEARKLLESKWM
ncbi:hypothetical protein HYV82_01775 [Candidatus Woesearchaeota archaeon]|nr:hypothetical protein [Candidatus Woesearchaeota archaeon]